MKLLDFMCNDCNTVFEELTTQDTKVKCPKCNSSNVKRLISGFFTAGSKKSHNSTSCSSSKFS